MVQIFFCKGTEGPGDGQFRTKDQKVGSLDWDRNSALWMELLSVV